MKKIVSFVLVLAMAFSLTFVLSPEAPALAASSGSISVSESEIGIGYEGTAIVKAPRAGKGEIYEIELAVNNDQLIDALSITDKSGVLGGNEFVVTYTTQAAGKLKITATFTREDDASIVSHASCTQTIVQPSLTVTPNEVEYRPGLTAKASVKNPAKEADPAFGISPNTATIDSNGNIIVSDAGTYEVTYTDENNNVTLVKTLVVKPASTSLSVQDQLVLHENDVRSGIAVSRSGIPNELAANIDVKISDDSVAEVDWTDETHTALKVSAKAVGTTVATISFEAAGYKKCSAVLTIKVVGENDPILTLSPTSMTLEKGDAKSLTISLDNTTATNVLLKVTGSKSNAYRGLAIDGYVSKNGVYVTVDGSNSVILTPKYNGTYYVTASANGADSRVCTVTVTGCHTLPQTGPDFTLVYVFAGLLLASLVALAVVNIKRKQSVQ